MKLILVCGPWSSGTTAVSGMLDQLGLDGVGPFFRTNDALTKNSFESIAFRAVINQLASEGTLKLKLPPKETLAALQNFRVQLVERSEEHQAQTGAEASPIFLKYPLSALLIPQICKVFDTRLIYVLRPTAAIEATRARRNWPGNYGALGANILYSKMFQVMVDLAIPTLMVRYPELLAAPLQHAKQLAQYCGLSTDAAKLKAAAQFVRRS